MPGTFSPPPISKETASELSRHASRHVRHARAVMHVGIAKPRWRGKTFPAFPAHAPLAILRIWQEAHVLDHYALSLLAHFLGLYVNEPVKTPGRMEYAPSNPLSYSDEDYNGMTPALYQYPFYDVGKFMLIIMLFSHGILKT